MPLFSYESKNWFVPNRFPSEMVAVGNLHFLSKNSTLISLEKLSELIWVKTRENAAVLDFLAVDNYDLTGKIIKKRLKSLKS